MGKRPLFITLLACCITFVYASPYRHHLSIDLSSKDYHHLWHAFQQRNEFSAALMPAALEAISGGEKLSQWITLINSTRDEQDKIRLTSPNTRHGTPIETPNIYGPKQISDTLKFLKINLPKEITMIVYGDITPSTQLPLPKETFIKAARQVDLLYQTAVRWEVIIQQDKECYTQRRLDDVRGYYYLKQDEDLDNHLKSFDQLPKQTQTVYEQHLMMLCLNAHKNESKCKKQLHSAIKRQAVLSYKNRYWQHAKRNWDSFFIIDDPRKDVSWSENQMHMPFTLPESNRLQAWLKDNVEDEFQYHDWRFKIDFVPTALSHLEFESNTTPHVTDGDTIVMDSTQDIEEYESQWTIRHEYGHILRLPDCYVEFYDPNIDAAVNYQLDVTDLMCSRQGNMNQRIYQELKKTYAH